jgi:hypothetical protein
LTAIFQVLDTYGDSSRALKVENVVSVLFFKVFEHIVVDEIAPDCLHLDEIAHTKT